MSEFRDGTLQLGKVQLQSRLLQAPLAGISCAPFRRLAWQHGRPGFCATEMISANTLINQPLFAQKRFLYRHPDEKLLCFQLSGNNADALAKATKIVTDAGADFIDLNCGCPKKKIRHKGAGSKLLSEPSELAKLIQAIRDNTHLPISIKIRVDGDSTEKHNEALIRMINRSGIDYLIVHGRHWSDTYENRCHYDQVQQFVEDVAKPVIGNGDIACVESYKAMLKTGCDGVMIARAGVGQPWLYEQLRTQIQGHTFQKPSPREIAAMLSQHLDDLMSLMASEKFAILQARKFAKYYARDIADKPQFINALNQTSTRAEFDSLIHTSFH